MWCLDGRQPARLTAFLASTAAVACIAVPASAAATHTREAELAALHAQGAAIRVSSHSALLELYAAQTALDRSRATRSNLDEQATRLAAAAATMRLRTRVVRRSTIAARATLGEALRRLYVEGDADPVAIIFGARSLDEAAEGIDNLSLVASRNQRLVHELKIVSGQLDRLTHALAVRERSLDAARRRATAAEVELARAVVLRQATLTMIRRRAELTQHQTSVLEARAAAASERSSRIATPPTQSASGSAIPLAETASAVVTARPMPGATRTLAVDAVAYHLSGRTASGLPVGVGVVAVDPRVIPLGTKLYVPGYGPAVAADVGSAVIGNIIDLWMPSTAQASAWGRRNVTITVYG